MPPLALIALAALAAMLGRAHAGPTSTLGGTGDAVASASAPDTAGGGLYAPGGTALVPESPGSSAAGPAGTGAEGSAHAGGGGGGDSFAPGEPVDSGTFYDPTGTLELLPPEGQPTVEGGYTPTQPTDYGPGLPPIAVQGTRQALGDFAPWRVEVVDVGVHTDVGKAGGFLGVE